MIINGLVSRRYEVMGCQFVKRMDRNDSYVTCLLQQHMQPVYVSLY